MSEKVTIRSYSIERIKPHKQHAIWVHLEPNILTPLVYLQRPKWTTDAEWEKILKAIKLDAVPGMLNE